MFINLRYWDYILPILKTLFLIPQYCIITTIYYFNFTLLCIIAIIVILSIFNPLFDCISIVKFPLDSSINPPAYWGKHSFLSILLYEQAELTNSYFENSVNTNLIKVLNYFSTISYHINDGYRTRGSIYDVIPIVNLQHGTIEKEELPKLEESRIHLRNFLQGMYNDIEDIKYSTKNTNSNDTLEYELILTKKISNRLVDVPAKYESNGTRQLIHLFPIFVAATKPGIVAIDEIDNGIHDILMTNLITNLEPYINEQLIITTHNLMLLNNNNFKDYFYFINVDSNGNHSVNTIKDCSIRIQSNYNLLNLLILKLNNTEPQQPFSPTFNL